LRAVKSNQAGAFEPWSELRDDEPEVGGMKSNLTRRNLLHTYEQNYFRAKPHVLVGPLKSEIYYLFEVTAVKPPRQQTLREVEATQTKANRRTRAFAPHARCSRARRKWPVRASCASS